MTWIVIVLVPLALALILGVAWQRKLERARMALVLDERTAQQAATVVMPVACTTAHPQTVWLATRRTTTQPRGM